MSLLLDARKKSQQALAAQGGDSGDHSGQELSLEALPNTASDQSQPAATSAGDSSREVGRNLFNAKSPAAGSARIGGVNRNLLFALGGTVLLLAIGIGYLWYLDSAVNTNQPLRPPAPTALGVIPEPDTAASQKLVIVENSDSTSANIAPRAQRGAGVPRTIKNPRALSSPNISLQPHTAESLDPLINRAYRAYRQGRLEEAQQMYLDVLSTEKALAGQPKELQNIDALLGLAAIAQQRGEDEFAAHYYLRALAQDPRNAVAHAGMSALSANENSESLLKNLLREQRNSAALHFALGNLYAGQSRWGEAQSAYFNAYTLDSKNAELVFNLAVSLDHLNQYKMAAQYYQRALNLVDGNLVDGNLVDGNLVDMNLANGNQSARFDRAQTVLRIKELTR